MLQNSGSRAVTPEMLSKFARAARQRIRLEGGGYRRDYPRALAQRVEVDTGEVKIMGSKSRLLQALVAGSGVNAVPAWGLKWRRERPPTTPKVRYFSIRYRTAHVLVHKPSNNYDRQRALKGQPLCAGSSYTVLALTGNPARRLRVPNGGVQVPINHQGRGLSPILASTGRAVLSGQSLKAKRRRIVFICWRTP